MQRNTAPAIGLAAHILRSLDPDAVMGVFPSDHVVGKPAAYRAVLRAALKAAAAGNLMVVGIQPRWPETGYGYIEFPRGTKPGAARRSRCAVSTRSPSWPTPNAMWPPATSTGTPACSSGAPTSLLDQLRRHLPKTASVLASLPRFGSRRFAAALKRAFPLCENISIDYAVLEKAGQRHPVSGIAAGDFGWNDVGSWNAVYELLPRDACGNVAAPSSICLDAHDNFVDARGKMVALLGVRDLIVVDTPDALLVAARDRRSEVGEMVKALEKRERHDLL